MSVHELRVSPEDLQGKAAQIRQLSWPAKAGQPPLSSPDALDTSGVAIANLAMNARAMWDYQDFGRLEGLRLAQTLVNVATAYAEVDLAAGDEIADSMDEPGPPRAADGPRRPERVGLPPPPHPPAMPIPKGKLVSEQLLYPPEAQRALEAGDSGASLAAAAQLWRDNLGSLTTSAAQFETAGLHWEGAAADAAYAKFNAYRDWLVSLAQAWGQLAGEAERIVAAHTAARRDHEPIAQDFAQLQREIAEDPASADNLRRTVQMAALQKQSEEIRQRYARDGQPRQIAPMEPPSPIVDEPLGETPATVDDDRRAIGFSPPRSGGAAELGRPPTPKGEPTELSGRRPVPAEPAEQAARGAQQGSPQSGGPAGTGQQYGAQPGAGSPLGPRPTTQPDPAAGHRVRPAASGGGGGRGGAVPPATLQPAVGAETVAPAPVPASSAAPATTVASSGGGAGMGGIAPMMHGTRGDGGSDKQRNPRLSTDSELYTEDRPWTEAVIGNRVRRRAASSTPAEGSP